MPGRTRQDTFTTGPPADGLPLVERERECATLRTVVRALSTGQSAVVVVRAEPGAGRSALLRRAAAEAESAGVVVARAEARRFESNVPLGVLAQLCEGLPIGNGVLGAGGADSPVGPAEHAGLCSSLLAVARERPFMVVVDDLEWIDEDSRAVLTMLLRRVQQTPIAVVLGLSGRKPTLVEDDVLLVPDLITPLAPRRLSHAAVRTVCTTVLGKADAIADVAVESTAGLPGLLVPALRRFARIDSAEDRSAAAFATLVSEHRGAQVAGLLEELSTESLDLLRALAVAGGDVELCFLRTVVRSAAGDSPARLRAAGLAEGTDRMRLAGPVASLALAGMSPDTRRALHASVAELAHRVAAPEQAVGRMLLGTIPFGAAWACDVLRHSAEQALRAGRDREAITFLERALAEPVSSRVRTEILVDLARAEVRERPRASDRRLADALAGNGPHRAHAAEMMLHGGDYQAVRRLVVVDPADRTDERRGLEVVRRVALMLTDGDDGAVLWRSEGDPPVDPVAAGVESWRLAALGKDLAGARELARVAVAPRMSDQPLVMPRMLACTALMLADELDEAREAIGVTIADARRRGVRVTISAAETKLAVVAHRAGRLDEAACHVEAALDALPPESWGPATRTLILSVAAFVALDRGLVDEAVREVETPLPPEAESGFGLICLLHARGAVRLALGDHEGALRNLMECGQRLTTRGWDNPALVDWRPLAAEAMVALGYDVGARAFLADAHRAAAAWGTATCVGAARLAAAKLTPGPLGLRRAARAERVLRSSSARLPHVEAQVVLAERLLEQADFDSAGKLLRTASATARDCGAAPLVRRLVPLVKRCETRPKRRAAPAPPSSAC